jgi:hypothetical protein
LWLGTTLPSSEVAVMMESPADGLPAQWEAEWRDTVGKIISSERRTEL